MKDKKPEVQLSLLGAAPSPVEGFGDVKYTGRHVKKDGKVYFPVVDIIADLVGTERASKYWRDMQARENTQLSAICGQLKFLAPNGKHYTMDCVDIEGVFRLVQSIPSPKVEPIKLHLAKLAYERIEEAANPELGITRARVRAIENWKRKGYSDAWIAQRLKGVEARHGYTDSLKKMGVSSPKDFAAGTAKAHSASFGLTPAKHKELKRLKGKDNLRDNMMNVELSVTLFSENLFVQMIEDAPALGETLRETQDKHAALMKSIREKTESTIGKKIATSETPLKPKQLK